MEETKELVNIDGLNKDITQEEKVEPVSKALTDMGKFWNMITTKLSKDSVCYMCKKKLEDKEHFDIIQVPDKKVDKGLIAYVSVCKQCNKE